MVFITKNDKQTKHPETHVVTCIYMLALMSKCSSRLPIWNDLYRSTTKHPHGLNFPRYPLYIFWVKHSISLSKTKLFYKTVNLFHPGRYYDNPYVISIMTSTLATVTAHGAQPSTGNYWHYRCTDRCQEDFTTVRPSKIRDLLLGKCLGRERGVKRHTTVGSHYTGPLSCTGTCCFHPEVTLLPFHYVRSVHFAWQMK